MTKVAVFSEAHSSNTGDQVIAESLRYLIESKLGASACINDISGRTPRQETTIAPASPLNMLSGVARLLPGSVVNLFSWKYKREPRVIRSWQRIVAESDHVFIGGGQLLMDNAMAFPLRIQTVSRICQDVGVPYHLIACGVGRRWSPAAKRILNDVIENAATISVRDADSAGMLDSHAAGGLAVEVIGDPALWAADAFSMPTVTTERPVKIGLGITSRSALERHGVGLQSRSTVDFWCELAVSLRELGHEVVLFCNGALDDIVELQRVQEKLPTIRSYAPPQTASELVFQIATFKALVSHRLHANIVACALGVSSVAIEWDPKVKAFYGHFEDGAGRLLDAFCTPAEAVSALNRVLDTPISRERLHSLKTSTLNHLRRVI